MQQHPEGEEPTGVWAFLGPPAAVSQDAWKEGSRAPTAFSEASQGVAGADTGKEGYLNESATHSPEGWAVAKSKGKRRG